MKKLLQLSILLLPSAFLFNAFGQCDPQSQCAYTFRMFESFGDGWNGNTMSVVQNGTVVATFGEELTSAGDTDPVDRVVQLCDDQPFLLYWNAGGNFPNEVGVAILDPFGNTIYHKPFASQQQSTTLYTGNVTCQAELCAMPTNLHFQIPGGEDPIVYWTSGGAEQWEIIILPHNAPAPSDSDIGIPATLPMPLAEIDLEIMSDVYVRSICAEGSSAWAGPMILHLNPLPLNVVSYVDLNENGTFENGEPYFRHGGYLIEKNNDGNPYFTSNSVNTCQLFDGSYNTYDISVVIDPQFQPYFQSDVVLADIETPVITGNQNVMIPVKLIQDFNDVAVIIGSQRPRAGQYQALILLRNNSYVPASGTTVFVKDPLVTIIEVEDPTAVITDTGFEISYSDLMMYESRNILMTLELPPIPIVNIGDPITLEADITSNTIDVIPENNHDKLVLDVINSWDPNDKTERHGPETPFADFDQNEELHYTIRFQNTGNAGTQFVRIEDELSPMLDENSVRMITSSHDYILVRRGSQLIWRFDPISLTPITEDEEQSQAHLTFAVKLKPGFSEGDVVPNNASIYFDWNPAIETELWTTTFTATLATEDFDSSFQFFPNPASDKVHLTIPGGSDALQSATVFNVLGKEVLQDSWNGETSADLSVTDLAVGMYIVKITTTDGRQFYRRLLKN